MLRQRPNLAPGGVLICVFFKNLFMLILNIFVSIVQGWGEVRRLGVSERSGGDGASQGTMVFLTLRVPTKSDQRFDAEISPAPATDQSTFALS